MEYSYQRDRMQQGIALRSNLDTWVYHDAIPVCTDRKYYCKVVKVKTVKQVLWSVGEARL